MISLRLQNGRYLHVQGDVLLDSLPNGDIEIKIKSSTLRSQSSSEILHETLARFDENPSYLNDTQKTSSYLSQPPTQVTVVKKEQLDKNNALINEGKRVFMNFVDMWKTNFGIEGEQPDRAKHLQEMMNEYSICVMRYLKHMQGLTKAVMNCYLPPKGMSEESYEYRKSSRLLAENIAQVCSILCPPISECLEYPFKLNKPINQ